MRGWVAIGALSALGCSVVFLQTDGFPKKLDAGCKTYEQCDALVLEAKNRHDGCQPNTVGKLRCEDTRADLRRAEALLEPFKRQRAEEEQARQAEQQRAESEQWRKDQEDAREREHEQRLRREREREEQQQARADAEEQRERELAEAEVAREVAYLQKLSAAQRLTRLRDCHRDGVGPDPCQTVSERLIAAAADEAESKALLDEHERLRHVAHLPKPAPRARGSGSSGASGSSESSGPKALQCCDGTLSPSCVCGGSRRGCCSHHGGVCGCED